MSLDVSLMIETDNGEKAVYEGNITHNLGAMAAQAGIYLALWHPEERGIIYARELALLLQKGLERLVADPERYKQYNPENGWGDYEGLVRFVREYLEACEAWPEAKVETTT